MPSRLAGPFLVTFLLALPVAVALGQDPAGPRAAPGDDSRPADSVQRRDADRGRWRTARIPDDPTIHAREVERLTSLGYAAAKRPAPVSVGVTRHVTERVSPGWNLVNSAHAPGAFLMDMEGNTHWRWDRTYDDIFPDGPIAGVRDTRKEMWRRARLLPDGGLIVVFESLGIVRLDSSSNTIWASAIAAHHDFEMLADGTFLVLTREARVGTGRHANRAILEDFVTTLDSQGRETSRFSLLEAATGSALSLIFDASMGRSGDLFHTNSIRSLDGALARLMPDFRAGLLLVSLRNIDTIAVVDPAVPAVIWLDQGAYYRQHDARLLPSGRILLFDNGRDASRILELDPVSREAVCVYEGDEAGPLFSEECGLAQRLPNGNTLVTETDAGRAIEVDPAGEVVWEYLNPFRSGRTDELVAALFEVERVAPGAVGFLGQPLSGPPPPAPRR